MTPRLTPALAAAIRALLRDLDAAQELDACPVCGREHGHELDCTVREMADALREAVSPPPSGYIDLGPMVKP